jgi:peptidoglycan-associated lipoprotein
MKRAAISRIAVLGVVVAVTADVVAGAIGCSKKKADEEGDLEGGSGDSEFSAGSSTGGGRDGDSARAEPERVRELGSVYFDFDSASIRDDARTTLKANGQAITGRSEWKTITLEGHTDERGSDEYNLALGERRANAAMQYLVDLGVPRARMITVSFGEGSPAVQGNDESAWRWNRRVDFKVSRR